MSDNLLPELGFYGLAGHTDNPADLLDECREAERLGLGSVFISERYNVKEASSLSGAAAAVTSGLGIATGVTNHNTRHPMITASWAMTMHKLSGGRFALGLGRGIGLIQDAMGIPRITMPQMEDFAGVCRKLWKGEMILGHDGPSGKHPYLRLSGEFDEDIPIMFSAIGPKTLEWTGTVADGVILHTFISDEALARCVALVRQGAERAGRNPDRVRVWSVLATVHEPDESRRLRDVVGRMATYMQAYGELLVNINGWDMEPLEKFRADPFIQSFAGAIDQLATDEQLAQVETLIPSHWLPAAVGSAEHCAARINDQFDAGCAGVIAHGSTPNQLAPVLDAYRAVRRSSAFAGRSANPGL